MLVVTDPSQPLKNKRHELFAIQKAKGVDNGTAWKNTIPFGQSYTGGPTSLRVSGHRVSQRNEVMLRVSHLIAEARNDAPDVQESFDRSDIIKLNLEVSEALQAAYEAAVVANVSPLRLEQLRTCYAAHLSRQGRYVEDNDNILRDDGDDEQIKTMMVWMANLEACSCPTH